MKNDFINDFVYIEIKKIPIGDGNFPAIKPVISADMIEIKKIPVGDGNSLSFSFSLSAEDSPPIGDEN